MVWCRNSVVKLGNLQHTHTHTVIHGRVEKADSTRTEQKQQCVLEPLQRCLCMWNFHFNKNTSVSVNNLSFHYSYFWVASFPGRLLLHFLDRIVTFEPSGEAGKGLVQLLHHQTTRWTQTWRNVDLVSVVMATCPRTRTAIDSKRHKTTRLLFQFIAMTKKTA